MQDREDCYEEEVARKALITIGAESLNSNEPDVVLSMTDRTTYHVYAEIPPVGRVFRVSLCDSLEAALEVAHYLRQTLPAVEVISTELDHVPDYESARIIGKQVFYEYD